MTLLDAKEYIPKKSRKNAPHYFDHRSRSGLAFVGWWNRFWPEERIAGKFFLRCRSRTFETAYGIYYADPGWNASENHAQYP